MDAGVIFASQDGNFKLGDGTINDDYLISDGVHLSSKETSKFCSNLKIPRNPKANGNVCKNKHQQRPSQKINYFDNHSNDGNDWQTVLKRQRHPPRMTRHQRYDNPEKQSARC